MTDTYSHPLCTGTRVVFRIEDRLAGTAIIAGRRDVGERTYRLRCLQLTVGDHDRLKATVSLEPDGSAWLSERYVEPNPVPLPVDTCVAFHIEELVVGTGNVAESEYDDGWLYRLVDLDITDGDFDLLRKVADVQPDGSAWFCEHELEPLWFGEEDADNA